MSWHYTLWQPAYIFKSISHFWSHCQIFQSKNCGKWLDASERKLPTCNQFPVNFCWLNETNSGGDKNRTSTLPSDYQTPGKIFALALSEVFYLGRQMCWFINGHMLETSFYVTKFMQQQNIHFFFFLWILKKVTCTKNKVLKRFLKNM